ncbi:MAG: hydantoinase/oxoprolinase family protein, partial [Chloroflexota bacterium]
DEFDRLRVGPQSAGASPGPVSYGAGGTDVTTTDANLALGCINPDYFCGGTMTADMDALNGSLNKLAGDLNLSAQETARGIVRLANNNMVNAIKLISVNRGHDPRDFTLIAFGGGGSMHACALAAELGIKKVVIPNHAGVFSAWGMLLSDLRRDYLRTQVVEMTANDAAQQLSDGFDELEVQALDEYGAEDIDRSRVSFKRYGRFRYQNQEHSTEVLLPEGQITAKQIAKIVEIFNEVYEKEYTYRLEAPVELVTFHLIAYADIDKLKPQKAKATGGELSAAVKGKRQVDYLEAGVHQATIYNGDLLAPGMTFAGPAVVEEAETTVVIPPSRTCTIDEYGNYQLVISD